MPVGVQSEAALPTITAKSPFCYAYAVRLLNLLSYKAGAWF